LLVRRWRGRGSEAISLGLGSSREWKSTEVELGEREAAQRFGPPARVQLLERRFKGISEASLDSGEQRRATRGPLEFESFLRMSAATEPEELHSSARMFEQGRCQRRDPVLPSERETRARAVSLLVRDRRAMRASLARAQCRAEAALGGSG
jgi:hypothetical protein